MPIIIGLLAVPVIAFCLAMKKQTGVAFAGQAFLLALLGFTMLGVTLALLALGIAIFAWLLPFIIPVVILGAVWYFITGLFKGNNTAGEVHVAASTPSYSRSVYAGGYTAKVTSLDGKKYTAELFDSNNLLIGIGSARGENSFAAMTALFNAASDANNKGYYTVPIVDLRKQLA